MVQTEIGGWPLIMGLARIQFWTEDCDECVQTLPKRFKRSFLDRLYLIWAENSVGANGNRRIAAQSHGSTSQTLQRGECHICAQTLPKRLKQNFLNRPYLIWAEKSVGAGGNRQREAHHGSSSQTFFGGGQPCSCPDAAEAPRAKLP